MYGYSTKNYSCLSEAGIDQKGTKGTGNVLRFGCGVGYAGVYIWSKFIRLHI